MNKLHFFGIGLVIVMFSACKKGESDPFLSLKTRNARIVGTWKLESSNSSRKQTVSLVDTSYINETQTIYENGTEISTGSEPDTLVYDMILILEKDGTMSFSQTFEDEYIEDSNIWYWSNDSKKKSGIVIFGNNNVIDRLTDSELVLKSHLNTYKLNEDGSSYAYDFENTMKLIKEK